MYANAALFFDDLQEHTQHHQRYFLAHHVTYYDVL